MSEGQLMLFLSLLFHGEPFKATYISSNFKQTVMEIWLSYSLRVKISQTGDIFCVSFFSDSLQDSLPVNSHSIVCVERRVQGRGGMGKVGEAWGRCSYHKSN